MCNRIVIGSLVVALLFTAATANAETSVQPGERVIVTTPQARLMRGEQTVATAARGQALQVLKVEGNWIGTSVATPRGPVGGWIWFRQVAPEGSSLAQQAIRRRFSFEPEEGGMAPAPAQRRFSYTPDRGRTDRTPSYFLPKTDPRRFR